MYLKLAWRNIWRNIRRTLITISSVAFAVFFAMLMRSMGEGSYDLMIENMSRFHTGFIQIQDAKFRQERSLDNAMAFAEGLAEFGFNPVAYPFVTTGEFAGSRSSQPGHQIQILRIIK